MRLQFRTTPRAALPARDDASPGVTSQAGHFALHFAEMCVVMCASLVLLGLLAAAGGALLGFADPRQSAPVLSAVVVTLTLRASMLAWMRWMQMAWRPTLEMVATTLLVGAVMVIGYGIGAVSAAQSISGICGMACIAMLALMLARFRMYATHATRHHHGA